MKDERKTKKELIEELEELRRLNREVEKKSIRAEKSEAQKYLDVAGVIIVALDAGGHVTLMNEKGARILGYDAEDIIGKNWFQTFLPRADREETARVFEQLMNGELEPVEYHENPVCNKAGDLRLISWHNALLFDDAGNIIGTLSSGEDITERRLAEEKLRRSEERYRLLFNVGHDGIFVHGVDDDGRPTRFIEANKVAMDLLGYTREEILKLTPLDLVKPVVPGTFAKFKRDKNIRYEALVLAKDGRKIPVEISSILFDFHGILAVLSIVRDISEQKRAREELARIGKAVESTSDAIAVSDAKGVSTYHNRAFIDIFGYDVEELNRAGGPPAVYKDRETAFQIFRKIRKGESWSGEVKMVTRDGRDLVVHLRADAIRDPSGEVVGLIGIGTDMTEVKKAERALHESEEKYRLLMENTELPVVYQDPTGKIILMNAMAAKLLGGKPEDFIGRIMTDIFEGEWGKTAMERIDEILSLGRGIEYEDYYPLPSGPRWFLSVCQPVRDSGGNIIGIQIISRDITERKQAEEALRQENAFRNAIIESAAEGLCVCHEVDEYPYVSFTVWNDRMTEITGFSIEEINRLGWYQSIYPDPEIQERARERMERMRMGDDILSEEWEITRKNGEKRVVSISTTIVRAGDSGVHVLALMHDVTAKKRAEEALAREKERLSVTLRSIGDGVISTDTGGRVQLLNKVAEEQTGWTSEEAESRPIEEILNLLDEKSGKPLANPVEKVLAAGGLREVSGTSILVARDGSERIIADTGSVIRDQESNIIGVVLVFRDITESRKIEEELNKAEKLESLGILAGGIAHDFNNILTGIVGNISLAKLYQENGEVLLERLEEAENACHRARDLTQQLLTFSRGGAPVKAAASLKEIIEDSAEFVLRGTNSRCHYEIESDLWPAMVDAGQISRVIQNLIINAGQAMPEGGVITLKAQNVTLPSPPDRDGNDPPGQLPPGPYNRITITDGGEGIPENMLSRIFDPFYTTKQQGSGLGLATSYSIIKQHGGQIQVESHPGKGTSFIIHLPAAPGEVPEPKPDTEGLAPGKGKVLVMEDEKVIVDLLEVMLDELGYEAVFTRDGKEAVDIYRRAKEEGRPFTLVIMDLTIPGGMGGKEAIKRLLEYDPEARAVVSSGYSTDPVMARYAEYGFKGIIAKPYEIEDLSRVLKLIITD